MSTASKIEWTRGDDGTVGATWNPVTGCTKVSAGCDHCYAETFAERWRGIPGHHFENGFDVTLRPKRVIQPLRWKRPKRIFVNSMSDFSVWVKCPTSKFPQFRACLFVDLRPRRLSCTCPGRHLSCRRLDQPASASSCASAGRTA